ncbi:MAG: ParA family protein [Desulfobacterales bacterium]
MGHVVCVAGQRGGAGKTTTAINLSAAFAMAEKKSLLVDCDPRGYATAGMGIDTAEVPGGLYEAMTGKIPVKDLLIDSELPFLKMLPAGIELARIETERMTEEGKEHILRDLIGDLSPSYDYITLDIASSLNLLAVNAIAASDSLIIPFQCELNALEELCRLLEILKELKEKFNRGIKIAGILFTLFDREERMAREIADAVRLHFNDMVYRTTIPKDDLVQRSCQQGKPIFLTELTSVGAQRYLELAEEFMNRWSPGVTGGENTQ